MLANSEPLHFRAFRDVLLAQGVVLTEAQYYGRYLGFDDASAFAAIGEDRQRAWTREEIGSFVAQKAAEMTELERDVCILFPRAADVVRRAASAVPIAIASGALGHEIRRVLDREQLTSCFSAIVAAEDTPRSKPSPDPYALAVELLRRGSPDLRPHECLAVEDSAWGLQSARAAGLRTIGVAQSYPAESLIADLVIPVIGDLDLSTLGDLRRL